MDFMSTVTFGAMGRVVKERNDFLVSILFHEPGMMLEAELDIGAEVKVGP